MRPIQTDSEGEIISMSTSRGKGINPLSPLKIDINEILFRHMPGTMTLDEMEDTALIMLNVMIDAGYKPE